MGQGIELGREEAPELAAALDNMKDQLLIALIKRLGGKIIMPVAEVDNTGQDLLAMSIDIKKREFHFEIRRKS